MFLAPSAYLATAAGTVGKASDLLPPRFKDTPDPFVGSARQAWNTLVGDEDLECPASAIQRTVDNEACRTSFGRLLDGAKSATSKARLLAASAKGSADWLKAVPIAALGLKLDDRAVSVAVGLRLGSPVVAAHVCSCGTPVGTDGLHGLACRRSSGRQIRHQLLNDIVFRALKSTGFPSAKEPVGLDRGDGKRPDGITLIPWSGGKCLTWDVTCADTFAASHVTLSSTKAGTAATHAETLKRRKYQALAQRFIFEPIAVETSGAMGECSSNFVSVLGAKIAALTGDRRETSFLRQRISVAIQRGNAISVLGTFPRELSKDDDPD